MKVLHTITETDSEGFMALLGKRVTIFSLNYIYTGDLVGVNETCVKLDNPAIVYETGPFSSKEWKDAQSLPNSLYVQLACIESFGVIK